MTEQSLNRHQRRRLRTKRQLEQAAMECLIETGYDRLTIQDIVDRADLGRGTFYIHFHDKEEIVWANFQHGLEQEKTLSSQNIENLSGQETLLSSLNTIFQHADQHRELYNLMLGSQGSTALTARVQNWLAADFEKILSTLEPNMISPPLPLSVQSQMLTGAFTRLVLWWLAVPNPYTPEEMAHMAFQGFMTGIQPAVV